MPEISPATTSNATVFQSASKKHRVNRRRLTVAQCLTYAAPQLPLAFVSLMMVPWLTYFYLPPESATNGEARISAAVFSAIMLAGRGVDALADPLIGYLSDSCQSPQGRRAPFIRLGTPILAVSFIGLWFPPFGPGTLANTVFFCCSIALFWFAFTAVVAPYAALLPEVTNSGDRVRVSSYVGVTMVFGTLIASIAIGELQTSFSDGVALLGVRLDSSLQVFALVAAAATALFWAPLTNIRESPRPPHESGNRPSFANDIRNVLRNPAFRTIVGLATFAPMGIAMVGTALPYFATSILESSATGALVGPGEGPRWTGFLMAILVLGALLWIPIINRLAPQFGKKWLMLRAGILLALGCAGLGFVPFSAAPTITMMAAVALLSLPTAATLVLAPPLFADMIDLDYASTGIRREGIYTGTAAVLAKAALGIGNAAVVGLLTLGQTASEPLGLAAVGPVAAIAILIGVWLFRKHPLD